ncbi:retrotransposable element Tf2 [Tanacetum coccineum]|uniref:Retrotransposable element Tf2 n=1 Tax=Tanacetum coccineum TaxID=301880 RepID=A0ABQ5DWA4_9ASTR
MAPNTRSVTIPVNNDAGGSGGAPVVDDNVRQAINEIVDVRFTRMQESIDALTRMMTVQGIMGERPVEMNACNGQPSPYTRLAKLEFPKFSKDDVKGWVFRCEQFFVLDQVTEAEKVHLISIHLYDKALLWHTQFLKSQGGYVNWETYKQAVLARFGTDDPMSELKNLKYETTATAYEDAFDDLLSRIEIREDHAISLFIGGLPVEIAMTVRMFKPKKLANVYCLTNLQEATLNAVKKKGRMMYTGSTSGTSAPKNNRKQLTQKEYQEKRANNQCFNCHQKYTPGHKCNGLMYALEVLADNDSDEECLEEEELGELREVPQISLNAMHGVQTYRTMRIKVIVGKHNIHILVDCGSTHNFVDLAVAKKLGCKIKSTCPLPVIVGDGYNIATSSECKQFHWNLQGVDFWFDVMMLPLGGCEKVLGIQWLSTLGDIKCNFKDLRMEFVYKRMKMVLRGTPKSNLEWITNSKQAKMLKQNSQPEYSSMQLCVFPGPEISLMRLEGISTEVKPELQSMIQEFKEVFFVLTVLPPNRPCDHKIPLLEGTNPVNVRPYRHPLT